MASKKEKQVKQETANNSLETNKFIDNFPKAPGQTGLHAPNSLDAVRKPPIEQRSSGEPFFGGVSEPKVSEQTYDCYKPINKTKPPAKKKENT